MRNTLHTLKQIKCKECKSNLEILRGYDDGDLFCSCKYIDYSFIILNNQLLIGDLSGITIVQIYRLVDKRRSVSDSCYEIRFDLNRVGLFNESNTDLLFNKSFLFNITEIEKALNVYSGIERNLIFK